MNQIIERDTQDARRELLDASLNELASEIRRRFDGLQERVQEIRDDVVTACSEFITIGQIARIAYDRFKGPTRGADFKRWWDDQRLPVGQSEKLLRADRINFARESPRIDKDQLRCVGILDGPEDHNEGQSRREQDDLAWIKLAGRIRTLVTPEQVQRMGEAERKVAKDQLKPLYELYLSL